jgi:hypothetical protein
MPTEKFLNIAVARHVIVMLSLCVAAACTNAGDHPEGWIGRAASELAHVWGPPSEHTSAVGGGSMVYISYWQDGFSKAHVCRRTFAVDARGMIASQTSAGC